MMEMMMYAKHNKKITHPCSVARALEELCMMCCFRVFFFLYGWFYPYQYKNIRGQLR